MQDRPASAAKSAASVGTSGGGHATEPVVSVRGLTKSFGAHRVLDGVDLEVAPRSAVALIGANGSGKSTFLKCLVRLAEPDAGEVRLLGEATHELSGASLAKLRSRVGIVFQKHNLVARLSALTNVVHGVQARARGPRTWAQALAPAAVRDEALACLEAVGLADKARQRVDSLSGGQSQRVAIARMLMQRPELVLADEPDASLDPSSGEEVMALLSNLAREKGLTLIVISHRLEHTVRFSDRIVGLQGGRIVLDQPSATADAIALRGFFTEAHP